MKTPPIAALALALPAAGALAGLAAQPIDLGVATDDVWAYVSATDPSTNIVLSVWGSNGVDLNPQGFPGPPPGRNFWSHAFLAWDLPELDPTFGWGGATVTVTLASDTWQPEIGNAFVRFLDRGFDEEDWDISSNTPLPVPALGFVVGDDTGAASADTTITFTLPADLDPAIWRAWVNEGQISLAITADTAPPPPSGPGEPGDLTGALQIYSSEDLFERGPAIVVINAPRRPGDVNGDGVVSAADLAQLLGAWGTGDFFADVDGDGVVNATDLGLLLGAWG